jgi:hypothetical protein
VVERRVFDVDLESVGRLARVVDGVEVAERAVSGTNASAAVQIEACINVRML